MSAQSPVPLHNAMVGQIVTVTHLEGGGGFHARLLSMGLGVGTRLTVLKGGGGKNGPMLLAVGHTRLALGHGMAHKILVIVNES